MSLGTFLKRYLSPLTMRVSRAHLNSRHRPKLRATFQSYGGVCCITQLYCLQWGDLCSTQAALLTLPALLSRSLALELLRQSAWQSDLLEPSWVLD